MTNSLQPKRAQRGCLWRIGQLLLGLVALLVIVAVLAVIAAPGAKANLIAKYPPPGALVDVGGYRMHIFCEGSGSPTVVMESGLGDPGLMWELVRPEAARVTRTCVYDRAGLGWSDASPEPRTAENQVAELHTLLSNAQIAGPYVLVGHSYGGPLVRLYAHTYPGEVAGIVLVDSSHEDQLARFPAEIAGLAAQGQQQAEQEANRNRSLVDWGVGALVIDFFPTEPKLPKAIAEAHRSFFGVYSKTWDTQVAEVRAFQSNLEQVRAARITTLGDIPLMVLTRGQASAVPVLSAEANAQMDQAWEQMQVELTQLSPQGKQVVAMESGHYIQLDQPQLVIDAIEQVVTGARQ